MTLRIEKLESDKKVTFVVSGRLDAFGLVELGRLVDDNKRGRRFTLDLKDVRRVDRSAVRFLAFCESTGVSLENCPAYIRDWILREEF